MSETAAGAVDSLVGAGRRPLTVGLVLVVTMVAFEALATATALPAVLDDLGGIHLYGWAFSAFPLAQLVGITVAGRQADRVGPARPLLGGLVLFACGLVVVGLAPTMEVVVAGRALQGFGGGAVPAVAYVAIGRGYPEALRPRMFAVLATAWVVPGLLGPGVSGAVAEHVSWRGVFLGLLPLVPLAALLVRAPLRRLGPPAGATTAPGSTGAAVRLAGGAAVVLAGLDAGSRALGLAAVAAGGAVALPALRRLLPAGTLRAATGVPAAVATRGLLTFAFFGCEAFIPLMLTAVRDRSTTVGGLVLTAATLSWTTGSWIQARLTGRVGSRRLAAGGLALVAAGVAGAAAGVIDSVPVLAVALAWGVSGLGIGVAYSQPSLVVLGRAGEAEVGAASAGLQLADVLGVALGTGVAGAIVSFGVASGWSPRSSFVVVDAVMVTVAVVAVLAAARMPRPEPVGA